MSVQVSNRAQPPRTMTTKEMSKSFLPIILFSIILPLIDIVTDLRLIIRLYSGVYSCIQYPTDLIWRYKYEGLKKYGIYYYEDGSRNISYEEWRDCEKSDDLSNFCQQNPNPCIREKHIKFATLLLGELSSTQI